MAGMLSADDVDTRASFVAFVRALRRSFEAAMAEAEPGGWIETRRGWTNWTLSSFIAGMSAWLADSGRLPLDRESQPVWSVLLPQWGIFDGGSRELGQYLAEVEQWAAESSEEVGEQIWRMAAEAMRAGVRYE